MKRIIVSMSLVAILFLLTACTGGSSSSSTKKEYDMPNESDKSFSDYVKRVDPELYNTMKDNYESAIGG